MKTLLKYLNTAFVLVGILSTHNAAAQALIDSAVSGMVGGGNELSSAARAPMPTSAIMNSLQRQGYSNISDLAPTAIGTPMHATAISPAGTAVELTIEPTSGKLLSVTPQ